ncbi:hypothetical protein BJ878DRAFT_553879 [Calycina marina]|uniref:Uncharacterized protein n=1 Tax=Calycina marina TaxID=1763456 RepID=A0A9P7Z9R0_9HELO|nr:hypothetical protein BJ878DRAFT_553879 [Calycina marina]
MIDLRSGFDASTWDPAKCYDEISPQFIHGFLSWACDQRRGKGGRRRPGIKYASSLETFWKCYLIVYKIETGRKLDPMIQVNSQDVVKIVAVEKDLDFTKPPSATMYTEDLAVFARVLLATTGVPQPCTRRAVPRPLPKLIDRLGNGKLKPSPSVTANHNGNVQKASVNFVHPWCRGEARRLTLQVSDRGSQSCLFDTQL